MADIKFEIIEHLCVLKDRKPAWDLELNVVKWNDKEPVYDIREWNEDHSRCGKGVTLDEAALKKLVEYCNENRIHEI